MPAMPIDSSYTSYDERDRFKRSSSFFATIGIAGLGGFLLYKNRRTVAAHVLNFASEAIERAVGSGGVNDYNRNLTSYNTEHRLVKELTKASNRIKGKAYSSDVARSLFHSPQFNQFRNDWGEDNLRRAFGFGTKEADGSIIPGGNLSQAFRAFKKPNSADTVDEIREQLNTRFLKLSRHSNYAELMAHRVSALKASGLGEPEALSEARKQFAQGMTEAHMSVDPKSHTYKADAIVDMVNKNYLDKQLKIQQHPLITKVLDDLGIKVRRVGDDHTNRVLIDYAISQARLDGDVDLLRKNLENFHDFNTLRIKLNGQEKDINLTLGSVAISKTFNSLREKFQLPVAPLQGGFNPFSFFPHMRGTTQQIIHSVDARNPLPFISDLTGKLNLSDPSSLGDFYIVGNKSFFGRFEGTGQFIGAGLESTDFGAQRQANAALKDVTLDIRDAKAGWLKEVNERATLRYLFQKYGGEEQSTFSKLFAPGGMEEGDSIFSKYSSVFTKFKDPNYFPNVYKSILDSEKPSADAIEKLAYTLTAKSGAVNGEKIGKILQDNFPTLSQTFTGLSPDLTKLISEGIHNDKAVLDYFSALSRSINLTGVQDDVINNEQLRHLVNSFQTSLPTALGYGKNNDPRTILDEIGLSVKGIVGESSKSQGIDYIRENILAEINLATKGGLSSFIEDQPSNNVVTNVLNSAFQRPSLTHTEKNIAQSYLLGHDLNKILSVGSDSSLYGGSYLEAVNLFRPQENASVDQLSIAFKNRTLVEDVIKRQFPLTGLNWEKPSYGNIPQGAEAIRGRYMVTRSSGAVDPLGIYDSIRNPGSIYDSIKENVAGVGNAVKDLFASSPVPYQERLKRLGEAFDQSEAGKQYKHFKYGIDDPSSFSVTPFSHYFLSSRLNKNLSSFGLSLGRDDMSSTQGVLKGILLKRLLPVIGIIRGIAYLDQQSDDNTENSPDAWLANIRANKDVALASFKDRVGITGVEKKIASLLPGSAEYLNWRPKSEEEYKEYLKSGRDSVRKSRGWLFGSRTPYAGNSVDFFEPNYYLRAKSNYESAQGGRKSKESFILNQLNGSTGKPFNLYAQEETSSKGIFSARPYVYSAPLVDPNLIYAGLINNTIGRLIKPQKLLNDPTPYMASSASVEGSQGPSTGYSKLGNAPGGKFIPIPQQKSISSSVAVVTANGSIIPKAALGTDVSAGDEAHLTPEQYKNYLSNVYADNGALINTRQPRKLFNEHAGKQPLNTNNPQLQYSQLTNQTRQLAGIYGFFTSLFTPSKKNEAVYAEASRAYSFESSFYDAQRGATFLGLPGQLVDDQNLNEIARRLITPKQKNLQYFNPIPNQYAGSDFLPGEENYLDFQKGDPMSQLRGGIFRLPGESYSRLYKPEILQVDAKDINKNVEDLGLTMVRPNLFTVQKVKRAKDKLKKLFGDQITAEHTVVEDKGTGVRAQFSGYVNGKATLVRNVDSLSNLQHQYESDKAELDLISHIAKTNSQVVYISKDNNFKVIEHQVDSKRLNSLLEKINEARSHVKELVKNRVISEADLYNPITKFDIASDVAPYAETTKVLASNISHTQGILEADWKRFQAIKKRTSEQKVQTEIFNYKFKNLHERIRDLYGTIESIDEKGTIYLNGQDTPIKLAGGRLSVKKIRDFLDLNHISVDKNSTEAETFLKSKGIYVGKRIAVKVDSDSPYEHRKDLQETKRAVFGGLNKQLIEDGFIDNNESDESPTTTLIKHSKAEIFFGGVLERIAHLDNVVNNKFLKVRSPVEAYRRQVLYGTNEGSWTSPYQTYIAPTVSALASKDPITATVQGAFIGSLFGITGKAKGKYGALIGGGIGLISSLLKNSYEAATGKNWVPPSVKRRREIEEYFDILKYVKERKLYEEKAAEASQKENINLKNLIDKYEDKAKRNEALRNKYLEEKKKLMRLRKTESVSNRISELNKKIAKTKEDLDILNLGPIATEALIHRKNYQSTMYGAKPGSPLMDIMSAMPKHERTILMESLKSSDKEKSQLYKMLSNPQKRVLGMMLGKPLQELPERPKLNEYFSNHQLPDHNSNIWDPEVDIEDLKVRALNKEVPRKIELGIFPQTVTAAESRTGHVALPYPEGKTKDVQNKLNKILSGSGGAGGRANDRVHVTHQHRQKDEDEHQVHTHIKHNRKKDYIDYINKRM